jgi:hypothetical protein
MTSLWPVYLLALLAIGVAVAAMAIGVILKRPCLRGSCGGPGVVATDGTKLSCATCPNRKRKDVSAMTEPRHRDLREH